MDDSLLKKYTTAPLQIEATIRYKGKSAVEVFDILGNPELITQWFLLAKEVKIHPPSPDGLTTFNVEFTFFGDVFEEILEWNPPNRYIYLAKGESFPIKDYLACIEVHPANDTAGILQWKIFYSQIEGKHFQKIIPIILPPIIEESFKNLCPLIGGVEYNITNHKALIKDEK